MTEFNTAHNKRISSLGVEEGSTNLASVASLKRKRKSSLSVAFREGEEIINPGGAYGSCSNEKSIRKSKIIVVV